MNVENIVATMGVSTRQYLWTKAEQIASFKMLKRGEKVHWMRDVVMSRMLNALKNQEDKWNMATQIGLLMAEEAGVDFDGTEALDLLDFEITEDEGQRQQNERGSILRLTESQKRIADAIEECLEGCLSS